MKSKQFRKSLSILTSLIVAFTFIVGSDSFFSLKASAADPAFADCTLIKNKTPISFYIADPATLDTATPNTAYYQNGTISSLTDGVISPGTPGAFAGAPSTNYNYVLIYDLGKITDIRGIWVLCNQYDNAHSVAGEDFYASDDQASLFNDNKRVYTSDMTKNATVKSPILSPSAPDNNTNAWRNKINYTSGTCSGRYVAIVITKADFQGTSVARVQEITIAGAQATITSNPTNNTMMSTQSTTLGVTPSGFECSTVDKTNLWSSSNPAVASIDGTGKITAKQSGTTTITLNRNGAKDSFVLTIKVYQLDASVLETKGASILLDNQLIEGKQALRFMTQVTGYKINDTINVENTNYTVNGFGTLLIKADDVSLLGSNEISVDNVSTYSCIKNVPCINTYSETDTYYQYTARIIKIPDTNYDTAFVVRPYIKCSYSNGNTIYFYGATSASKSVNIVKGLIG